MPYDPKVNPDLAGQYLYSAITDAGKTIGAGIEKMVTGLREKAKERKLYLGVADTLVKSGDLNEMDHAALQNLSTDEIKGKIMGLQTAAHLKKLRDDNLLSKAHVDTLNAALKTKANEEAALQRFNELFRQRQANAAGSAAGALSLPNTLTLSGAGRAAAAQPVPPPPVSAQETYGMAARAGAITPEVLREMLRDQTDRETQFFGRESVGVAQPIRTPEGRALPGLALTTVGPRQSQVVPDLSTMPPTQTVTDASGVDQTVLINPKSGAPTVIRPAGAQARRADAATIAQLEGTLQKLDEELKILTLQKSRAEAGEIHPTTKKPYAAPPAGELERMERRRKRIESLLSEVGDDGLTTPAVPEQKKQRVRVIGPNGQLYTVPADQLDLALRNGFKQAP